jgi:RNA polymerase sigma-70 factor (ECF subfamily)
MPESWPSEPLPPEAPGRDAFDDRDPIDDGAVVRRIAAGDEAAFMSLYDGHATLLYGTSLRFLRDRDAAAEVVQETFLAAWQRAAQFDPARGSIAAWLLGIARNRALDRLRAEGRRPTSAATVITPASLGREPLVPDRAAPESEQPEATADRRWLRALLRSVLAGMRPEEREVLVLAYDRDLSQAEIAEHLGLPIGTVKSRTRRALAVLRGHLAGVPDLRAARDPARSTRGADR